MRKARNRMLWLIGVVALSVAAYGLIAGILILSSWPAPPGPQAREGGLDFGSLLSGSLEGMPPTQGFPARDGQTLAYRAYRAETPASRAVYLLHGSGWHGMQFHGLASFLAASGLADVYVPDLRGHGAAPGRRGDIDHIGQLEEDLADLILHVSEPDRTRAVIVGGHSSGGGLAVRFAGGAYGAMADGYLLLAPFLKYNAPTTRPNSGGWARPLTRRIIGLTMLNAVGIDWFNSLTVIQFNMPQEVLSGPLGSTATTAYSYRLNTAYAPRSDFRHDLASIQVPLLVVAGSADEAFVATAFEPEISAQTTHGEYATIDGAGHLDLVDRPELKDRIERWLTERFPGSP